MLMAKERIVQLVDGTMQSVESSDNIEDLLNAADAVAVNDAVYLISAGTVAKALSDQWGSHRCYQSR